MSLTALLDLELAVPEPDELVDFWLRRGMVPTAPGVLGTVERPSQLRVREGGYRHVSELRIAAEAEADLVEIRDRLRRLGLDPALSDGRLQVDDPLNDHVVVVEVATPEPLAAPAPRQHNAPGSLGRVDRRSRASISASPQAPRRVGHAVFGTTDVEASRAFYVDGLGFRISDVVGNGIAYFLRCSSDHHNLLLSPAPVPCMNHYAVEMDDVDAIGLAGMGAVLERPDCQGAGIGRHVVGANLFWYLLDPSGGMFELYADMDQILDDERWDREERRDDCDPFTVAAWNSAGPEPDFWMPSDLDSIAAGRAAAGR